MWEQVCYNYGVESLTACYVLLHVKRSRLFVCDNFFEQAERQKRSAFCCVWYADMPRMKEVIAMTAKEEVREEVAEAMESAEAPKASESLPEQHLKAEAETMENQIVDETANEKADDSDIFEEEETVEEPAETPVESPKVEESAKEPEEKPEPKLAELAKPEPKPVDRRKVLDDKAVGVFSEELLGETRSEEEIHFDELRRAERRKTILYGTVVGVKPVPNSYMVTVTVFWNDIPIMIPDVEYFEPEFDFGPDYNVKQSEDETDEKLRSRNRDIVKSRAGWQMGAIVPFVVTRCQIREIKDGIYEGQKEIIAFGSKRQAMELLRDYWFIQEKGRKDYPAIPKRGNIAKVHVLSVKPDNVLVECLGVETRILRPDLSDHYIANCSEVAKVGQTMKAKIEKIYINDDKTVYITLTGRLHEPSKLVRQISEGESLLGTVKGFNPEKQRYMIITKGGVMCTVRAQDVVRNEQLVAGDMVIVTVTKVLDTFVSAYAIKI